MVQKILYYLPFSYLQTPTNNTLLLNIFQLQYIVFTVKKNLLKNIMKTFLMSNKWLRKENPFKRVKYKEQLSVLVKKYDIFTLHSIYLHLGTL